MASTTLMPFMNIVSLYIFFIFFLWVPLLLIFQLMI